MRDQQQARPLLAEIELTDPKQRTALQVETRLEDRGGLGQGGGPSFLRQRRKIDSGSGRRRVGRLDLQPSAGAAYEAEAEGVVVRDERGRGAPQRRTRQRAIERQQERLVEVVPLLERLLEEPSLRRREGHRSTV